MPWAVLTDEHSKELLRMVEYGERWERPSWVWERDQEPQTMREFMPVFRYLNQDLQLRFFFKFK